MSPDISPAPRCRNGSIVPTGSGRPGWGSGAPTRSESSRSSSQAGDAAGWTCGQASCERFRGGASRGCEREPGGIGCRTDAQSLRRARRLPARSLLALDHRGDEFEIIVVDAASTDDTAERVKALIGSSRDPAITYVRNDIRDANSARNAGLATARAEGLVALVDDDVLVPPRWLMALREGAAQHVHADCLGGPVRPIYECRPPRACAAHEPAGARLDRRGRVYGSLGAVESTLGDSPRSVSACGAVLRGSALPPGVGVGAAPAGVRRPARLPAGRVGVAPPRRDGSQAHFDLAGSSFCGGISMR